MKKKTNVVIRDAKLSDLERIAKIEIENHANNDTPLDRVLNDFFLNEYKKRWRQKLLEGIKTLLISFQGKNIGFISYSLNEMDAEIHNIYIMPLSRRQHFGKLLCVNAINRINKAGKCSVKVWLVTGRKQIIKFYEALGFIATNHVRSDEISEEITLLERQYVYSVF